MQDTNGNPLPGFSSWDSGTSVTHLAAVVQPLAAKDENGRFEEVYSLQHFTADPAVRDRQDELAAKPDGLILDGVWAFTHTGGPSGLEITEVEMTPPDQHTPQPGAADEFDSPNGDTEDKR